MSIPCHSPNPSAPNRSYPHQTPSELPVGRYSASKAGWRIFFLLVALTFLGALILMLGYVVAKSHLLNVETLFPTVSPVVVQVDNRTGACLNMQHAGVTYKCSDEIPNVLRFRVITPTN